MWFVTKSALFGIFWDTNIFFSKKADSVSWPKILTHSVSKILENSKKINHQKTHENALFRPGNKRYTLKNQKFSDPVRKK